MKKNKLILALVISISFLISIDYYIGSNHMPSVISQNISHPPDAGVVKNSLTESDPKIDNSQSDNLQSDNSQTDSNQLIYLDPCIDTGDPSILDEDGTRSDMGCYPLEHTNDTWPLYTNNSGGRSSTVKWQSMPALDTVTTDGDMASNVLEEIMGNDSNPAVTLDNVFWKELGTNIPFEIWKNGTIWENDTETLMSIQGYKFKVKSNLLQDVYLNISGFQIPEDTEIPLKAGNENWIGYFMEDTREWDEAFGTSISNIYSIQTQYWTRQREMPKPSSPWKEVTSGDYTLSRGDMVIVKCFDDEDFKWFDGNIALPLTVPKATAFSFEEELDYLPVYVEFDDEDIPIEVAVIANGICQGAAVVNDGAAEICAYITNNGGENLELEFYYGERAEAKTIKDFKVYDVDSGSFISKELTINPHEDYYHISLSREQESVTQPPNQVSLSNYPNPFNPTSNISYSLPEDSSVELNIFNIKGQLVKHLAKGKLPAGDYNISWNGIDDDGIRVGSGIYFSRLKTEKEVLNKKMVLLK